jgi:hypothetical protein
MRGKKRVEAIAEKIKRRMISSTNVLLTYETQTWGSCYEVMMAALSDICKHQGSWVGMTAL